MGTQKAVEIGKFLDWSTFPSQRIFASRVVPLLEYARGRRVLDVGCAGSDAQTSQNPVHRQIARSATYCLGLDVFEAGVKKLASDGDNVIVANAEDFDLPEKDFEVATMGEIIEHVSNPGKVLDNVYRHLSPGGRVVITTPNPFALTLMLKRILLRPYQVNTDHVTWFDPVVLSYLLERSGFVVEELFWTDQSRQPLLQYAQNRYKNFNNTFGLVGRKGEL